MKNETLIGAIQKLPNEQLDKLIHLIDGIKLSRMLNDKLQAEMEKFKNPELKASEDEEDKTVKVTIVRSGSELFDALDKLLLHPEKAEPVAEAVTEEPVAEAVTEEPVAEAVTEEPVAEAN